MKIIGFANEYYTLWDLSIEELYSSIIGANVVNNYKSGEKFNYSYIKNISKDIEKVRELYPDLSIDVSLKGKNNSFSEVLGYSKVEYATDVFSKGYNRGIAIESCVNYADLEWSYLNENDSERKNNIEKALNKIGAVVYNGDVYENKDILDAVIRKQTEDKNLREKINSVYKSAEIENLTMIIEPLRNLSKRGVVNIEGLNIFFPKFKVSYYNGYEYGLPTDNKGVGKKIKNKKVEIVVKKGSIYNEFEDSFDECLEVVDFKLLK